MSPSTPPIICSIALSAMAAAGTSHWWSVRQMTANQPAKSVPTSQQPRTAPNTQAPHAPAAPASPSGSAALAKSSPPPVDSSSSAKEQFYENLLAEIRELRTQNRDLRDQIAETNRDVMKLEFRVDTHSESFRPMRVSEDRPDTSFDDSFDSSPGVLPPRAIPAFLPDDD